MNLLESLKTYTTAAGDTGDLAARSKAFIEEHGDDMPASSGWRSGVTSPVDGRSSSTEGDNVLRDAASGRRR